MRESAKTTLPATLESPAVPVTPVSRRRLFAGATTLGAVAATAAFLPGIKGTTPPAADIQASPEKGGGYRLSEHIKQYYKSALI